MNQRGNMTVIVLSVLGLLIGFISLYLQLQPLNTEEYEQTIENSCIARGYEHATFTEDGKPACCRLKYCVNYETAMQYGPGYEPTTTKTS